MSRRDYHTNTVDAARAHAELQEHRWSRMDDADERGYEPSADDNWRPPINTYDPWADVPARTEEKA